MYAEFFGLRELPFNNTPDPRFFFSTPDHEEALASLIYTVQERKGFVLLTGEVGAGKTLMSRMMLRRFAGRVAFASIHHAVVGAGDLIESVCAEFELRTDSEDSHTTRVRALHDFLLERFGEDTPVVLVLDEAQSLPIEAYEQLRMIGNLEADDAKLLQIVILGQPELQRRFASSDFHQLKQRVFRSFHLPALTRELTEQYIKHRLGVAGASGPDVFDASAICRIYEHSQGLPRLINTICDNSMLSGYSADRRHLSGDFIDSVVAQMMNLSSADGEMAETREACSTGTSRTSAVGSNAADSVQPSLHEQPSTTMKSGELVEILTRHVALLEARLRGEQAYTSAGRSVVEQGAARGHFNDMRDEGVRIEDELAGRISESRRRLSELDVRMEAAPALLVEAQAVRAGLEPVIRDAKHVIDRAESSSSELTRREAAICRMAAKTQVIVDEVRRILDGLKLASAKAHRVEREARAVHDRLVTQTAQSRKVAGDIAGLLASVERVELVGRTESTLIRQATVPADSAAATATPATPATGEHNQMERMLRNSREGVMDLRSLVRRSSEERAIDLAVENPGCLSGNSTPVTAPTSRLAREVNSLLELAESSELHPPT